MSDAPFALWDPALPFPAAEEMPDLAVVTHIQVERAQPETYHYLHESSPAWHNGKLYVGWANHRELEVNTTNELVRGRCSTDGGYTWSDSWTWAEAPANGAASYNHPVIASRFGKLWGFFTRWDGELPSTEVFVMDDATGAWESQGARIPKFVPFRPPMRMADGNWIMSGELHWYEAAVAISDGDDFTRWTTVAIPRPHDLDLLFPEATLLQENDRLVAIIRPRTVPTAPVAESTDFGRTWTTLVPSNYPMAWSQPYCGTLSTGQHFLLSNDGKADRALLSIAVTEPGGNVFRRIWKLRHQRWPKRRLFGGWGQGSRVGTETEWSYPGAVEYDGKLYISYTQGKEDCVLSIVPITVLAAD